MRGEPFIVKQLLTKAKDSALLAIEFYNKPAVAFKSEGFITMMCIAWTSLFHAFFFKNKIKPYYRKNNRAKRTNFEKIRERLPDGKEIEDYKWWDLAKCIKEYFKDQYTPVRKNLEFFYRIRNLIVHRNIPELDANIYGECQANILNFNNFLIQNFGEKHRIDYMLSYSLQMFANPKNFLEASKNELKKKNAIEIVNFIKSFRSSLTDEIFSSPEYAFKAVLIQVKNYESKDALALQVVKEEGLTQEQREQLKNSGIVLVKERRTIVNGVPPEYSLDHKSLISELKKQILNIKLNKDFYKNRSKIIENNPTLMFIRRLDPRNPRSAEKKFYKPVIIDEFKKLYNLLE